MTMPTEAPAQPPRPKKRRKLPWILGVVAVVIIVIVVVSIATSGQGTRSTATNAPPSTATPGGPAAAAANPAAVPPVTTQAPPPPPEVKSGSGDDVVTIHQPSGVKVVRFACPACTGNTVVKTDGAESLLVNTIGAYSGQQWIDVQDGSTTSTLTITATSKWTLTIGGLDMARHVAGPVSGTGDDVVVFTSTSSKAAITNKGSGNFVLRDVSSSNGADLAVNEIGGYTGTVPLAMPSLVQVTSDGSWTINPS